MPTAGGSAFGLLVRMRARTVWNAVEDAARHSKFKFVVILVSAALFWGLLFVLFKEAFVFVKTQFEGDSREITAILFSIFFLLLFTMLLFSNGIIAYASYFRSPETLFLRSHPLPPSALFLYKALEPLVFSSWAFLFMGTSILFAYAVSLPTPWYFFPAALLFFFPFVLIPSSLGILAAFLATDLLPHHPPRIFKLGGLGLAGGTAAAYVFWRVYLGDATPPGAPSPWWTAFLGKLQFANFQLAPNYWMTRGILHLSQAEVGRCSFFLALIVANALFFSRITFLWAVRRFPHLAASHLGTGRRKFYALRPRWERAAERLLPLSPTSRHLLIKDLKTFVRDPVQWSQFLVFFGILAIYVVNIRNLAYNVDDAFWKNLISLLNLCATCLTLSTFTSRFVFPMLSLEGRNFWVLGLMPVERSRILWGKFIFSAVGSLAVSGTLIVISDHLLRVPVTVKLLHLLTVVTVCLGLSGTSVGLGALYPNLKESDPSKIVSGFGGTLNLLVSLVFVFLTILLQAIPSHLYYGRGLLSEGEFTGWIAFSIVSAVLLGLLHVFLPMRLGIKKFERMEF